jgi:hypothetical protein
MAGEAGSTGRAISQMKYDPDDELTWSVGVRLELLGDDPC